MARANRYYIPGHVWHITHRCHKKEFLLKFSRDRENWLSWLYEAKKRFGLRILNYTVTSNHIHLLVIDSGQNVIPKSLQLIAGRTAQEFNQRKSRKGAFWEDRDHATAIERGEHLMRCLVYIDLNMVRAGVVKHPSEWLMCGYNEIQNPPDRYTLIDQQGLVDYCSVGSKDQLIKEHRQWVEEALKKEESRREASWSESIAVGTRSFIERTRAQLGLTANNGRLKEKGDQYVLREEVNAYSVHFDPKMGALSPENSYYWNDNAYITTG
ncbi:MAG: transposase [Deltaproteobacteria bacterium]|nr:transposase [Deltaproteobacteria bacterium]